MTAVVGLDEPAGPGPPSGVYSLSLAARNAPAMQLSQTADFPAFSPDGTQVAFGGFGRDDNLQYPGIRPHGLLRVGTAGGVVTKSPISASLRWHGSRPHHADQVF